MLVKIGLMQKNIVKGILAWKVPLCSHAVQFSSFFRFYFRTLPRCHVTTSFRKRSIRDTNIGHQKSSARIREHRLRIHFDYFSGGFSFVIQVAIVLRKLVRMTRRSFPRPSLCDVPIINVEKPSRLSTMKESLNLVHCGGQKIKYLYWLNLRLWMTEHAR
jgi:hypothetical protein